MKMIALLKRTLLVVIMVSGLTITSSCDSCNRPNGGSNDSGTGAGKEANGDIDGSARPADNEDSGSTEGTNTSSGTGSDRSQD